MYVVTVYMKTVEPTPTTTSGPRVAEPEHGTRIRLTIHRLDVQDFGNYTCTAINRLGRDVDVVTIHRTLHWHTQTRLFISLRVDRFLRNTILVNEFFQMN